MWLLDVGAVLDREKDIRIVDPETETEVLKELDDKSTTYAILSHRWGTEVTYDEMTGLTAMKPRKRDDVRERDGYQKIIKSCELAKKDGYRWLWIDTCCIDKRSSAALSEAINSMYRWYHNSEMCYVYLHDVDGPAIPTEQDFSRFGKSNGWPEWFSRGWTLQELIAPEEVEFFNKNWVPIGTKEKLASTLENITRIPKRVLGDGQVLRSTHPGMRPCVAQIMSWAADRKTTRVEDRAYSLMGLFGVNMPMLYGEGSKAFQRLQLEIIRASSDHSIFAWNPKARLGKYESVLAGDPSCFRGCHDVENVDPGQFAVAVEDYIREAELVAATDRDELSSIRDSGNSAQLLRWDVTNLGIHLSLPVLSKRDGGSFYKAKLPCRDRRRKLITVDLESRGLRSYRTYLAFDDFPVYTCPEFRSLYLDFSQEPEENGYKLRLEDGDTSSHGFTRCGTFPREVAGDTVTFSSQGDTLIILVYTNDDARCRFAVGLGYYLCQAWGRVICNEYSAQQGVLSSWADFAKQAYDIMWNAPVSAPNSAEDIHLPRTIFHVKIDVRLALLRSDPNAVIRIKRCPGCCGEPGGYAETSSEDELYSPLMCGSHGLKLNGQSVWLVECSGQRIELGDYGDFSNGGFTYCGNILKHMQQLRISDSVYRPTISPVSSYLHALGQVQTQCDVVTTCSPDKKMVLHEPRSLSLPNNEDFKLLLRALSTRLAGYGLVTTVIKCSEFYKVHGCGEWIGAEAPGSSSWSTDSGTFTPLCFIAVPRPWGLHCARRQQFKRIREHFYTVADLHHIAGTEARHDSADQRTTAGMVDISVMFGLDYLRGLVGEITFLERLPTIMQTWRRSDSSVGMVMDGDGLSMHPSDSFPINLVLQNLRELLNLLCAWQGPHDKTGTVHNVSSYQDALQYLLIRKPTKHHDVEFISESLSTLLLERIRATLQDALEHTIDMGRVRPMIKEIEALQARLGETEDDDEQRALEEDLTGQILWFCWCGILSEVDYISTTVVKYIQVNKNMFNKDDFGDLLKTATEITTTKRTLHVGPANDIAHMRRIMFDAGAGVSRHKLWIAARAAGQKGDVMEVHAEMSPAAGSTIGPPTTGPENDATGAVEAGNYTGTTSLQAA